MRLVPTIARRSLLQRRTRTLFSAFGVALGIAVSVGVFTLDHNTVLGLSLPGLADWKPALEVRPARGLADARADLVATPGVAGVSAFFQNDVQIRRGRKGKGQAPAGRLAETADGSPIVRLVALEASSLSGMDALRVSVGSPIDPTSTVREVLVGEKLADELSLKPRDLVYLARPSLPTTEDCIDGVRRKREPSEDAALPPVPIVFRVSGILAYEKLGRRSQGMVAVIDYAAGLELFAGVSIEPSYWVRQDPRVDIERLRSSLAASFSYELNKSVLIGAAADERAFRNGVRMAGLLALVLGLYVIFHTLSMGLVERVREVATLHALGCTRGQVARIFLAEALAISGLAAVLGLSGGLVMARGLLLLGITTLGTGHHIWTFVVPWVAVLSLTGLGVGVALIGSIYPLLRARGSSPVAVLRGEEVLESRALSRGFHTFAAVLLVILLPGLYFVIVPVVGEVQGVLVGAVLAGVGILAMLVVVPMMMPSALGLISSAVARPLQRFSPLSGRLAARSIREGRARIGVSTAAIALVAAAFTGLKGMTASLRGEIEVWAQEALVDKAYVGGLPSVPLEDLRRQLERYPGVLAIESGSARTYVPFLLLGMSASELARYGPCREDPAVAAGIARGTGVILSRRLARHLSYSIGDRVHVANARGSVQDLEVLAISDSYGYFPQPDERLYGVVGEDFVRNAFCLDAGSIDECAVVLERGADPEVVLTAVRVQWPNVTPLRFVTGADMLQVHLDDIDRDFRLFDIILGLTAALAGLGVLNGLLLSALERTKELGLLGALGASRSQIAGMVLYESAVVGLLGGILGTALGAAITPVIVRALEGLSGLDLPERTAGPWLWLCPAGALALAILASLYPIRRMNRTSTVAAVRSG
ncbi:MAG: ABC transporter permease [Planctomycetota bacterium]